MSLDVKDFTLGTAKTVATTEAAGVHTPHHRDPEAIALLEDILAGQPAGGATETTVAAILAKLIAAPATEAGQAVIVGHIDGVEAALASVLAKIIAAPATEAKQDTLIAKDFATQATLAALLAKVIAAPSTEAKQDTIIGHVDGIETLITALNALITTQNGYLDGVEAALAAAQPAGENHIGSIGGNTAYVDVTLTLDTSIYASGDVLADTQAVAGAMRVNAGTGVLQSITVIDQDDQKAQIKLLLMTTNVSLGTENSAPSISDTDALQALGAPIVIEITDYTDLGGVAIAGKDNLGRVVKAGAGSSSLYIAVLNGSGTPTYTASGIKLRLGFLQD